MNLLFTLDKNYISQLKVCVHSILRFPAENGYDVYVMQSDFAYEDKQKLKMLEEEYPVRFHFLDINNKMFDIFPANVRYPKTIYYRILAASFLPESLERVLYLDPDIVAIKPLDRLYHMDFGGRYFIACSHTKKFLNHMNRLRLGIDMDVPYINTGVMVMNLEILRKEQSLKELFVYVKKRGEYFLLPDQDIITALYGHKVLLVDSMVYNLSDRLLRMWAARMNNPQKPLEWVQEHTVIVHYCGRSKPWLKGYRGVLGSYYQEIAGRPQRSDNPDQGAENADL